MTPRSSGKTTPLKVAVAFAVIAHKDGKVCHWCQGGGRQLCIDSMKVEVCTRCDGFGTLETRVRPRTVDERIQDDMGQRMKKALDDLMASTLFGNHSMGGIFSNTAGWRP